MYCGRLHHVMRHLSLTVRSSRSLTPVGRIKESSASTTYVTRRCICLTQARRNDGANNTANEFAQTEQCSSQQNESQSFEESENHELPKGENHEPSLKQVESAPERRSLKRTRELVESSSTYELGATPHDRNDVTNDVTNYITEETSSVDGEQMYNEGSSHPYQIEYNHSAFEDDFLAGTLDERYIAGLLQSIDKVPHIASRGDVKRIYGYFLGIPMPYKLKLTPEQESHDLPPISDKATSQSNINKKNISTSLKLREETYTSLGHKNKNKLSNLDNEIDSKSDEEDYKSSQTSHKPRSRTEREKKHEIVYEDENSLVLARPRQIMASSQSVSSCVARKSIRYKMPSLRERLLASLESMEGSQDITENVQDDTDQMVSTSEGYLSNSTELVKSDNNLLEKYNTSEENVPSPALAHVSPDFTSAVKELCPEILAEDDDNGPREIVPYNLYGPGSLFDIDTDELITPIPPAVGGDFGDYVNHSETLQTMIALNIDLHSIERDSQLANAVLRMRVERDLMPRLLFLKDCGIKDEDMATVINGNPLILTESLRDMRTRVAYFQSKRFTPEGIARILLEVPLILTAPVKRTDNMLAYIMHELGLTAPQLRQIVSEQPKILEVRKKKYLFLNRMLINVFNFHPRDVTEMVVKAPGILFQRSATISDIFHYLSLECDVTLEQMKTFPGVFLTNENLLRTRINVLKELNRFQLDPTKENFTPLDKIALSKFPEFATEVAKIPAEKLDLYVRSL